jgi:type IV pilus assembly protein PilX
VSASPSNLSPLNQRGTLLIVVLLLLVVTSILGLSAIQAGGLEMQMSSNSAEQLQMLATAEYVVAQVTEEIEALGGFSSNSLANVDCGELCFDDSCSGGYCFFGAALGDPLSWHSCAVGLPALAPARDATVWADGSGRHRLFAVADADVIAKYIIEFRCYSTIDNSLAMDDGNNTPLYRITALVTGKSGRSGQMLRVTVKNQ